MTAPTSLPDSKDVLQNGDAYTPDLAKLKRMFTEAQTVNETGRLESQTDDDYFNGYQLTPDERRVLQTRRQPDTIFNRVRPAVLGCLGVIKQGKTDPRAYARNPDDEDSSDVVSKVLRFIADETNFHATRVDCSQSYLVQGTGAVIVEPSENGRIDITKIPWEEFFYDPRARRQDFADARYMGIAKWLYADDVEAMYPKFKGQLQLGMDAAMVNMGTTFNDRPANGAVTWIDPRRRRVLVVEVYHREGAKWYHARFYGNGILEAGPSPYLDDKKKPTNPIVAQTCFIDRENNRYGIVRDMRGPQDEINKRRQKLLHLLNSRQLIVGVEGFDASADLARTEAGRPDGVIPFGFTPAQMNDTLAGQFNLLEISTQEIERMGPNPAVLGRQGEDQSGRAQLVRQQAGLTELAVVLGGIEEWELRVYRACWTRARQYWKAADYIRVTDDSQSPEYIGINQPQVANVPAIVPHPQTGMPMAGMKQVVLGYKNSLAELDVDITLDTVPNTANLATEQFNTMMDMMRSGAVQFPPEIIIEMSSLPNKRELIEKLRAATQQPDPKLQLDVAEKQADIAETQSMTALNNAKTQEITGTAHVNALTAGFQSVPPPVPPPVPPQGHADTVLKHSAATLNHARAAQIAATPVAAPQAAAG